MTQQINNINNIDSNGHFALPFQPSQANYVSQTSTATPPIHGHPHLPAFLNKLYGMVNSPETDPWVYWNDIGTSFIIPDQQALAEHVLGHHFKHSNFASFVRQLNMYGFHKVPHLNHGVLNNNGIPELCEFTNDLFRRDRPELMENINRKKGEAEKAKSAARQQRQSPSPPTVQLPLNDTADVAIVRAEIQNVANRQNMIKDEVFRLAANTEELWKYALETRRQYRQQQDRLDKIISFLSEAFLKRAATNTELPNKVRGLLELPAQVEELSPDNTSGYASLTPEYGQWDVMKKMFANGKIPVGLQEAVSQYLQNANHSNVYPTTPISPTSIAPVESLESPEVASTIVQAANNNHHVDQVQQWLNETDQNINALGVDLNPGNNVNYADYLNDSHFTFDPFVSVTNPDPALDMFSSDTSAQPTWISQYLNSEQTHDTNSIVGQKRTLEEEEISSAKRSRI